MKNRNRIEDLGRITELLNFICENELFTSYSGRNKDFIEWFDLLSEDDRDNYLHNLIHSIDEVQTKIGECYEIARWGDDVEEE